MHEAHFLAKANSHDASQPKSLNAHLVHDSTLRSDFYRMDRLCFWEAGEEWDRDMVWLLVATGRMVPSTASGPMQHARKWVQDLLGLPAPNPDHSLAARQALCYSVLRCKITSQHLKIKCWQKEMLSAPSVSLTAQGNLAPYLAD